MIATATTQQQPAFSCFSEKEKKKNKKWLLLLLSHIYIPTGHHVNFTVLTLVELYQWQETDRGRCWWRNERMKGEQSEVKEVNGKGTCVGRKPAGEEMWNVFISVFHIWKKFMPQFCWFWRILLSVCCQALVFWCEQVWDWCVWRQRNVCFQIGGMDKRKERPTLRRAVA